MKTKNKKPVTKLRDIFMCKDHPRYQIKRKPTSNCSVCHALYDIIKANK